MADKVMCIDGCGTEISDPKRPVYVIKANGKHIKPEPRCAECLAKYEAIRLEPKGGLRKLEA